MTAQEFIDYAIKSGCSETEARLLWQSKPDSFAPDDVGLRRDELDEFLADMNKLMGMYRSIPSYNEILEDIINL